MIDSTYILLSLIPVILSALGTGIGQGLIGKQALQSMLKQPTASNNISKLCIIGTAVTETAAILGILMSLMLLGDANKIQNTWSIYGVIGIACAVGISGFCAGIGADSILMGNLMMRFPENVDGTKMGHDIKRLLHVSQLEH